MKKLLSILLVLIMVLGMFPASTMAADNNNVSVGFSVIDCVNGKVEIMHKELSVEPGLASKYIDGQYGASIGLNVEIGENDVTPIDVLVAAHLDKYGQSFTDSTAEDYITGFDYITKMFGVDSDITYTVNGIMPYIPAGDVDNTAGYDVGYAINQYAVKPGDEICFYRIDYMSYPQSIYASFSEVEYEIYTNEELTVNLGFCATMSYVESPSPATNAEIYVLNEDGTIGEKTNYETDENGAVTVSFESAGIYYLTCMGELSYYDAMMGMESTGSLSPAYTKITVNEKQAPSGPPAFTPQIHNKLLTPTSVTYFEDDTPAADYFAVKKVTDYENPVVEWVLQVSDAVNGAFADTDLKGSVAPTESNSKNKINYTLPGFTEAGTKYYRFKLIGKATGCTDSEPVYSEIITVTYKAGNRPYLTFSAPVNETGEILVFENNDIQFNKTLPLRTTTGESVTISDYNSDKYYFLGWTLSGPEGEYGAVTTPTREFEIYAVGNNPENDETIFATWAEYIGKIEGASYNSLRFRAGSAVTSVSGPLAVSFSFQTASAEVLKDITVTPVFKVQEPMVYTPSLVETEGGSISRTREEGETHTLYAKANEHYKFDRWEQSTDGGNTWNKIEGAEATAEVTLTSDTSYRAIFTALAIENLSVKNYALTSEGESLFITLDAKLSIVPDSYANVTINVYEGEDATGTLLGTATGSVSKTWTDETTLKTELEVNLTKRPSSDNAKIFVTAELPNGKKAETSYTLKGTLDVTPAKLSVERVEVFFLGTAPESYQLSVSGSPAPENVNYYLSWSGQAGNAAIDENGVFTVGGITSGTQVYCIADAGDGRIARCTVSLSTSKRAMKLSDDIVYVEQGKKLVLTPELSQAVATLYRTETNNGTKTTVTSSDENVFTAAFTTKKQGNITDCVDQLVLNGVAPGVATVTITVGVGDSAAVWNGTVIVPDPEATISGVSLTPENAEINTGDTLQLVAAVEPYGANHILWYESSNPAVARVDDRGVVTGMSAGTAVITVSAKDDKGNTVTDTCEVIVVDTPYQVNVYVPKNTVGENELNFYATTGFDSNNKDTFDSASALAYTVDSDSNADYDIYKLTLKAGTYSFRAEGLGGGCFAIPAEKQGGGYEDRSNTAIYLRKVEAYILNTVSETKARPADFSVEMSNKLGAVTMGNAYTNAEGYGCYPALVYANGNALLYYANFIPSESYASANSVGSVLKQNYALERGTSVDKIEMTLPSAKEFVINAPAGADVALFNQIKNFNTVRIDAVATRPQTDGTIDYVFNIARNSNMSYRASMEGKRTQSGFFTDIANNVHRIVIDFGTDSPKEQDNSGEFNGESSTLLNINERNKLNLAVGEQYKVRAYRAAWQIINTITANIMIEPDFHYTVLSGEDVIGIETVSGGNAKDNWAWITAKKEGVAIVEVSYDAINVVNSSIIEGRKRDFYGASDPNRTGVFVVTVGSQYGDIGGINLDTEYNEVYFAGEHGNLTIAPKGDNISVSVASVWEGRMSGWTQVTGESGTFNVPIQSGNNILKITSNGTTDYRVVRGSKVTPVITNKTNAERTETVYPGDEIEIGFKGIYMPMPKFSGIYNPGYPSTMGLSYKLGEESVSSPSTQYKLNELKISLTVPSDAAGAVILNEGKVYGAALGSNWGEHRTLTDLGVGANFNASGIVLENITLPDLTIRVARLSDDAAKQEAKDNINAAFASYDESKYSSQNWTEIIRIKDEALAAIDNAETLSAITEIKNTTLTAMANIEKKDSGNGGGTSGNTGNTGINKTHTTSYYSTTGLDFGLSSNEIEGYVTISFEDYGKRLKDADFETPLGVLIKPTKVPFKKGDSIARVTVRLLDALGIQYAYTGSIESGFYLSKLKNFKLSDGTVVKEFGEFDSGAGSGWMITCNNWFVNRGTDEFKVEDGDLIKWQNTCQLGADIGCDWSKQSAKITGFKFERNYGTLNPKFSDSTKDYVYTVSSSVKSISMEATLENYWAILTCTSNGKTYKPMESIPVENGTVIEFRSSFAEYAGDVPTDEDYRTITIQVKGESTVTPGGNAGVKDTAKEETTTTIKPEVTTNSSGEAKVEIKSKDVTNALTQAEKDNADVLEIAPKVNGDASKVEVSLPAESLNKIAESGLGLNVNTPVANIKLPEKAVSALATQDGKLNVTASSDKDGKISIDVSVGGKTAEKIDGGVKLALSDADNDKVMVIVNEDGSETIVTKHIAENGEHQAILPGSATIKMIDNHKEFTDTNGHWGEDSINFVAGRELYQGVGDGRFDTEGTMTRAMLVTVLYRLEGKSETDYEHSFNDVADDQWYADSVAWANANNIVKGVAEDSFEPDAFVTREQVATILYRYAQYLDMSTHHKGELTQFDDHHEVSDWAKDAKSWAVGAGIITGKPGNILDAGGDATRTEVAVILQRIIELMVK